MLAPYDYSLVKDPYENLSVKEIDAWVRKGNKHINKHFMSYGDFASSTRNNLIYKVLKKARRCVIDKKTAIDKQAVGSSVPCDFKDLDKYNWEHDLGLVTYSLLASAGTSLYEGNLEYNKYTFNYIKDYIQGCIEREEMVSSAPLLTIINKRLEVLYKANFLRKLEKVLDEEIAVYDNMLKQCDMLKSYSRLLDTASKEVYKTDFKRNLANIKEAIMYLFKEYAHMFNQNSYTTKVTHRLGGVGADCMGNCAIDYYVSVQCTVDVKGIHFNNGKLRNFASWLKGE